jgi:uncharacterized membrane protein
MMFGYGNGWPVWEGILIWAGYALISSTTRKPGEPDYGGDPRRILDERLARGEIDAAEYQRLSDLIAHGGQAPAGSGSGR